MQLADSLFVLRSSWTGEPNEVAVYVQLFWLYVLTLLANCNALETERIDYCSVTFSSSINEHSGDDDDHYHYYAQSDDDSVVLCRRNGQIICEESEEVVVLKCVGKKKTTEDYFHAVCREMQKKKLEQTNVRCFCLKLGWNEKLMSKMFLLSITRLIVTALSIFLNRFDHCGNTQICQRQFTADFPFLDQKHSGCDNDSCFFIYIQYICSNSWYLICLPSLYLQCVTFKFSPE